jgi:hypothetical protein
VIITWQFIPPQLTCPRLLSVVFMWVNSGFPFYVDELLVLQLTPNLEDQGLSSWIVTSLDELRPLAIREPHLFLYSVRVYFPGFRRWNFALLPLSWYGVPDCPGVATRTRGIGFAGRTILEREHFSWKYGDLHSSLRLIPASAPRIINVTIKPRY